MCKIISPDPETEGGVTDWDFPQEWEAQLRDPETDARWNAAGTFVVVMFLSCIGQGFAPRAWAECIVAAGFALALLAGWGAYCLARPESDQ